LPTGPWSSPPNSLALTAGVGVKLSGRLCRVGGVCGNISKFGVFMANAHGIPALQCAQTGKHACFLWQNKPGTWRLSNDVYGWANVGRWNGIQLPFCGHPTYGCGISTTCPQACGVCDGNGLSCAAAQETTTHHATILITLLAFAAVMVVAFVSCARCRFRKRRRRVRRAWQGYQPV